MRTVSSYIRNLWANAGPFVGTDAVHGRITVEPAWQINAAYNVLTPDGGKLPFRYWQDVDNTHTEVEVPNIKSIDIDRTLDAPAQACTIVLYNQWMDDNTTGSSSAGELGHPGYLAPDYRSSSLAVARWGSSNSPWNGILIPNALIRTYQGYGGLDKTIPQAVSDGNLLLTGVWLVDDVRVSTDGTLTLQCRDMAKLLIEQQIYLPLVPAAKYPLHYERFHDDSVTNAGAPGAYDFTDPTGFGPGNEGPKYVTDVTMSADGKGYWVVSTDGGIFSFNVPFYGSRGDITDSDSMVSIVADPLNRGYWTLSEDGGVFTFGEVGFYGSASGAGTDFRRIEAHPDGKGYWVVQKNGTVHAFGSAQHHGDRPAYGAQIIDIVATATGNGYWLLGITGAVFTFGDALYYGGGEDVVVPLDYASGMAKHPDGNGYWINTWLGDVSAHGSAQIKPPNGAFDRDKLNDPMVAIAATPTGLGYLMVGGDGSAFVWGDAPFFGDLSGDFTYTVTSDGNYRDYSDIVYDLLLWSGFYLAGTLLVYGNIEATNAFAQDALPDDLFDKKPVIDAITSLKEIVGYHFWIDDEGAARFESPNFYVIGQNFLEDGSRTRYIPDIDERVQLTSYQLTYSDKSYRSEIIISTDNPTDGNNTTVTTRYTLGHSEARRVRRGMIRPAMWVNSYFNSDAEQLRMAELIGDHIVMSLRQGNLTCWANPAIQPNDQVRIYERQSGEVDIHYVRGVHTVMDLDAGSWTMDLTTNWLTTLIHLPDPSQFGGPGSIYVDENGRAYIIGPDGNWATLDGQPVDTSGGGGTPGLPPPPPPPPPAPGVWVDRVGVCTHMAYLDTAYGDQAYVTSVIADLGIKHLRDGWGVDQSLIDYANDLHATLGVHWTLVCDPRDGNDPAARVAALRQLAVTGALDTIEGPNEPGGWDANPATLLNGWTTVDWVTTIRNLVRADAAFANVKLAAPSLADTNTTSKYGAFGLISGLDYGVTHDYPGDTHMMTDAIATLAQSNARIIAGAGKPVIATETGFTTGTGGPYTPVTEAQQADLTVQLFNVHQANGMRRTFIYELLSFPADTSFEGGLSMVRVDRSVKPVYAAVKALLAS